MNVHDPEDRELLEYVADLKPGTLIAPGSIDISRFKVQQALARTVLDLLERLEAVEEQIESPKKTKRPKPTFNPEEMELKNVHPVPNEQPQDDQEAAS